MKQVKIRENITWLRFDTVREMNLTCMRPQELYECQHFSGKVFTWKAYKDFYRKKNGRFTYLTDIVGMNFPGEYLVPFKIGMFNPLTVRELKLLDLPMDGYIICTGRDKETAYKHELAHAFYYTEPDYRKEVDRVLAGAKLTAVKKVLRREGYDFKVMQDECHAFILDWFDLDEIIDMDLEVAWTELQLIFDDCVKGLI